MIALIVVAINGKILLLVLVVSIGMLLCTVRGTVRMCIRWRGHFCRTWLCVGRRRLKGWGGVPPGGGLCRLCRWLFRSVHGGFTHRGGTMFLTEDAIDHGAGVQSICYPLAGINGQSESRTHKIASPRRCIGELPAWLVCAGF